MLPLLQKMHARILSLAKKRTAGSGTGKKALALVQQVPVLKPPASENHLTGRKAGTTLRRITICVIRPAESSMALKRKQPVAKRPVSDRDFEVLLRRASECLAVHRPHLVKKNRPSRKAPRSAA
jgi:hypothetical protein